MVNNITLKEKYVCVKKRQLLKRLLKNKAMFAKK